MAPPISRADLLNFELRWLQERELSVDEVARCDEDVVRWNGPFETKEAMVRAWLRHHEGASAGGAWERWSRRLGTAGTLLCFALGSALALGVLTLQPVDLHLALGLLVGLPLLLVLVSIFLMGFQRGASALEQGFCSLTQALVLRASGERTLSTTLDPLRHTRGVIKWIAFAQMQRMALASQVGILALFFMLVVFSDLRFSWSTSLSPDSQVERMQVWCQWLSWPWSGLWVEAVPSLQLIESTLNAPAEGRNPGDERWWPFLLMTILVYGFVPRFALALWAGWKEWDVRHRFLGSDGRVDALCQRLVDHQRGWATENPDPEKKDVVKALPFVEEEGSQRKVFAILWMECPANSESFRDHPLWDWQGVVEFENMDAEPELLHHDWLLLVEAWQVPSKKCLRNLRALRERGGSQRSITIGLMGGDESEGVPIDHAHQAWARQIAVLDDPHLSVAVVP